MAPISLELEDEDHEGNESNDICDDVRVLDTGRRSKVDTREHDLRPVGPLVCVRCSKSTPPERVKWNLGKFGG